HLRLLDIVGKVQNERSALGPQSTERFAQAVVDGLWAIEVDGGLGGQLAEGMLIHDSLGVVRITQARAAGEQQERRTVKPGGDQGRRGVRVPGPLRDRR